MRDLTKTEMPRLEAGLAFASVPGASKDQGSYEHGMRPLVINGGLHLHGVQDTDTLLHKLQNLTVPGAA
jgi:hypothetical protein